MEELIAKLVKKLSSTLLGDAEILKDTKNLIPWEKLQEIKPSIANNPTLSNNDAIHLYYSRYLQTLLATEDPLAEAFMHGITLLVDLKNCINEYNIENSISILIRKIGKSIKLSSDLETISKLVKEIIRVRNELNFEDFSDIENDIYLGLNAWRIEKNSDFDALLLRECYININKILKDDILKQKTNDLVAIIAYNWFWKTYKNQIKSNFGRNLSSALDNEGKRIFNWITSIDCRQEISEKIENLEPLTEENNERENLPNEPSSMFRVTSLEQLIFDKNNPDIYIYSVKKGRTHIKVIKATHKENGQLVILKQFTSNSREDIQKYLKEVEIYEKLSQTKLDIFLNYYGHFFINSKNDKHSLCIVLEYCDCTLMDEIIRLNNDNRRYDNHFLAEKISTLLDLFCKLRKEKINYSDIKPQNIFIKNDGKFKLGGFDLFDAYSEEMDKGTKMWMSPELIAQYEKLNIAGNIDNYAKFNKERSDVYALGLIFLMMATFRSINGLNEKERQSELKLIIDNLELGWLQRLLRRMLAYKYQGRPRFKEALMMLKEDPDFILSINSYD